MDLSQPEAVISQAVLEVGSVLSEKFQTFNRQKIKMKSAHEIVTEYDLLSEKIILAALQKNFPDHAILSEEQGQNQKVSDWLWAVDPIDGTTNFTMHNPLWCISVGLFYKQEIVLGLVHAPVLQETYLAKKGQGAWRNGQKIQVSSINQGKVLNAFCHGYDQASLHKIIKYFQHQKLQGFDCRQLGSAALELAYLAAGRLESLVIPGANTWDIAAGILLTLEAGGQVTDAQGHPWLMSSPDMIASNGLVHNEILEIFKQSQNELA